ncbi:MAG: tetratricopeptide repeat protein [Pirellulaceae bacterium]|nr:tetratricopeptide repeat protein [Pirellulaceae bacterium]
MPTTINGIGTHYYGKRDLQTNLGTCENCRQAVNLQSYTTRLWGVFVFIPIIPLGRKRILDYCPQCTQHRAIALKEWERLEQETLRDIMQRAQAEPDNPDVNLQMIGALATFGRQQEARQYAAMVRQKFADNASVQLELGGWYETRGQSDDGHACMTRALELEPDNLAARRAVGLLRVEQGRLDEARELLSFMESPGPDHEPGVLILLANAYREAGRSDAAMRLYELVIGMNPALARDRTLRKQVRACERSLGRVESSLPRGPGILRRAAIPVGVAVVVLAALFLLNLWFVHHQPMYVVNGLEVPIRVVIDGEDHGQVPSGGRCHVTVREGPHQAVVRYPDGREEAIAFAIENSLWQRFQRKSAFVLNPSGAANLLWQEVVYRADPREGDGSVCILFGDTFCALRDIDYPFKDPPDEIDIGSSTSVTKRTIELFNGDPHDAIGLLSLDASNHDLLRYLEHRLRLTPDDREFLLTYARVATMAGQAERCRLFLEAGFDRQPISVEWHRYYQSLNELNSGSVDLVARYDRLVRENPEDVAALYLRGRIEPDAKRAIEYFDRVVALDPDYAYAHHAKAYSSLVRGRFDEARPLSETACRLDPENPSFLENRRKILLGLKEYATLENEIKKMLASEPLDIELQAELLTVLIAAGKTTQARRAHEAYARAVEAAMPDDPHALALRSQIELELRLGNTATARDLNARSPHPPFGDSVEIAFSLELNEMTDAEALLVKHPLREYPLHDLWFSIAWAQKGDDAKVRQYYESAVAKFKKRTPGYVALARLLEKGEAPTIDELHTVALDHSDMLNVLVALAERFPDRRAAYLEEAERINLPGPFPYHFLKRSIDRKEPRPLP